VSRLSVLLAADQETAEISDGRRSYLDDNALAGTFLDGFPYGAVVVVG
jgi:hypothetical protein